MRHSQFRRKWEEPYQLEIRLGSFYLPRASRADSIVKNMLKNNCHQDGAKQVNVGTADWLCAWRKNQLCSNKPGPSGSRSHSRSCAATTRSTAASTTVAS